MLFYSWTLLIATAYAASPPLPLYGRNLPLTVSSETDFQDLWTKLNAGLRQVLSTNIASGHTYPAEEVSFSYAVFDADRTLYHFSHTANPSYLASESTNNVDSKCYQTAL